MTGSELIDRYEAGERDFQGANLEEMDLSYAYLVDANFQGANFRGANLTSANFAYCVLLEVNFAEARMENTRLWETRIGNIFV